MALGTQRTTVLAIGDNDDAGTIGFTSDRVTVSSTAGVAVLTVTRTGKGLAGGISVDFAATFFDFNAFEQTQPRQTGTIVFAPGQTSRTITLPPQHGSPLQQRERLRRRSPIRPAARPSAGRVPRSSSRPRTPGGR